ncbi:MAG: hypothetical protein Q9160_008587 [Pyrenula sp. 1 TL-2023]
MHLDNLSSSNTSPSDIFSDESSFYGEEDTIHDLERRVDAFDPGPYWATHAQLPQVTAAVNRKSARFLGKGNLYDLLDTKQGVPGDNAAVEGAQLNPILVDNKRRSPHPAANNPLEPQALASSSPSNFTGPQRNTKQRSEPPSQFLSRLPPSTTPSSTAGPWLWVYPPTPTPQSSNVLPSHTSITSFSSSGHEILESYLHTKARIEEQHQQLSRKELNATLAAEREQLESRLRRLARQYGITHGKWMLFVYAENVDEVWRKVVEATADGTLGDAAKVATLNDGDSQEDSDYGGGQGQGHGGDEVRVICVYTADCEDIEQVKRVCLRLQELGLAGEEVKAGRDAAGFKGAESRWGKDKKGGGGARNQGIYYKCDAWTYLGLKGGNRWGLRASMYSSREMLGPGGVGNRPWVKQDWRRG